MKEHTNILTKIKSIEIIKALLNHTEMILEINNKREFKQCTNMGN